MAAATPNRTEVLLSLPNPFTPLAFLPPDVAWQVTVSTYWVVGSLAVLLWDILSNLHNDYTMLTKYPLKISMVIYCISRISCLAHLTVLTVFLTAPLHDCSWLGPCNVLYLFAIPTTHFLFFFRVCALYYNNKSVQAFFFILWLAVLGGSSTTIRGVHGARIGLSNYCTGQKMPPYVALSALCPLIYDTLIYCATTYALLHNSYVDGVQRFNVMVFGKHLPEFSRAILQDGQAYYLTTLVLTLTTIVMIFMPGVPVVYACFIGVPGMVVVNCMTCLVYRNVRFGVFRETAANPTVSLRFAGHDASRDTTLSINPRSSAARSIPIFTRQEDDDEEKFQLEDLRGSKSGVDIDEEAIQ